MNTPTQMRDFNPRSVPDNATPYMQGRADQRKRDWPVMAACLLALVIYVVFTGG